MLFLTGVPRNVNFFKTFVDDVRAQMVKLVYNAVNSALVTGNGRSGNYDSIVCAHCYGGVFAVGHTS